ncbi:MAG TPA: nuclear transport factor 2 family protein [Nitrososphaeraceae archaeon]|nr:nuclear transport factor 2 family protein [Nitrososphaeraceae archaeon]
MEKGTTTATTIKKENLTEQEEQSGSKNNQTSSIIPVADKINIQELIAKYNITLDNKNIDEWLNTWSDDGVWSTPFGEAKGKTELKILPVRLQTNLQAVKDMYQQIL